jgi:hypothetical protein
MARSQPESNWPDQKTTQPLSEGRSLLYKKAEAVRPITGRGDLRAGAPSGLKTLAQRGTPGGLQCASS